MAVGLPFVTSSSRSEYLGWPRITDLHAKAFPGLLTSRDNFVIAIDRDVLEARMRMYFNASVSDEEIAAAMPSAIADASRFDGAETRKTLVPRGFLPDKIVRYAYRPFDNRWLYWEPETKLLHEKRSEYFPHVGRGNLWIEARQRQTMAHFDRGYVTGLLADSFGAGCSSFFPARLNAEAAATTLLDPIDGELRSNLTPSPPAILM